MSVLVLTCMLLNMPTHASIHEHAAPLQHVSINTLMHMVATHVIYTCMHMSTSQDSNACLYTRLCTCLNPHAYKYTFMYTCPQRVTIHMSIHKGLQHMCVHTCLYTCPCTHVYNTCLVHMSTHISTADVYAHMSFHTCSCTCPAVLCVLHPSIHMFIHVYRTSSNFGGTFRLEKLSVS